MRAQEFVTELFQPGKDWKWSFQGSEEAVAVFRIGEVPYMFHAYGADGEWEAEFKQHGSKLSRTQKFGLTGTGNSAEVMSTVVDIMRAFLDKYKDKIQVLGFSAKEDSRQGLYARMVKRLLPDWTMTRKGEFFILVAPTQNVAETWGVEKYPIPLPIGQYLAVGSDEFAPPGNYASADDLVDDVYDLIDAGIEPEVVAVNPKTLLATQDWLSNASGDGPLFDEYPDKPVVYKKASKLYILDGHHRTTRAWRAGRPISVYLFRDDQLRDDLDENFADGKNPGRKGLAKRVGIDTKASVSDLRKTAKNSSGEKQRMAHWLANMKSGRNKNK
jgi:hypothetical protein